MVDLVFFSLCCTGILILLLLRYYYSRSLTGLTSGGEVGPSYWGSYSGGTPDRFNSIELPKYAKGICPSCQKVTHSIQCSHEFNER